jgi:hypothetical protein
VASFTPPHPPAASQPRYWIGAAVVTTLTIGLALGWLAAGRSTPAPQTPPPAVAEVPPTVIGVAELFTGLWLSGDVRATDLTPFHGGEQPPVSGSWVGNVVAISAESVGWDRWQVTLAVDSLEPADDGYVRAGLAYYVVAVDLAGGRPTIPAAPARVPAPANTADPSPLTDSIAPQQVDLAQAFVVAHLTSDTQGFSTAPYASVEATVRGADAQGRIVVAATASSASGTVHDLEYVVTFEREAGQWVVADIGPWWG